MSEFTPIDSETRKKFEDALDYLIHSAGGLPMDDYEQYEGQMEAIARIFGHTLGIQLYGEDNEDPSE